MKHFKVRKTVIETYDAIIDAESFEEAEEGAQCDDVVWDYLDTETNYEVYAELSDEEVKESSE